MVSLSWFGLSRAQDATHERKFPQSRTVVEEAIRRLKTSTSGRLPMLEGFAVAGEHPLDQFQRGYYQVTVQVSPAPAIAGV